MMFIDAPETLMYVAIGAFVLGWLVAKVSGALAGKFQAKKRDPRDDRIRNLDAELRIAQSNAARVRDEKEKQEERLSETQQLVADKDLAIVDQKETIAKLRADLRDSVQKTRELRAELSHRAEESVRSEVKLREVETELSVAQASTDMISTGVLDYTMAPDAEDAPVQQGGAKPVKSAG